MGKYKNNVRESRSCFSKSAQYTWNKQNKILWDEVKATGNEMGVIMCNSFL